MKKLLLVIIALVGITILKANPIVTPGIGLSEVKFDQNGKWTLELEYFYTDSSIPIDSVWVKSNSGEAKLKNLKIVGSRGILLVESDSLNSPLTINQLSDSISIAYSVMGHKYYSDPMIYGYANSRLRCPRAGQSIAAVFVDYSSGMYSTDKSPTFGVINDSIGMCGTIKGNIYDKNNQLLSVNNQAFVFEYFGFTFYPRADGSYSTRYYSMDNNKIYKLRYKVGDVFRSVDITPIVFSLQPDSVVTIDIHLSGNIVNSVNEIESGQESVIHIFPNPIRELSFNYEVSIPVKSSNSYMELISVSGQKIAQYPVTEAKGKIDLPANIINGTYTISLFVNNKNYAVSKLLIAR